jgi:site-specific recombinase XerD
VRKRTPNAQRNFVMALRGFMAFAVKAELIDEDPTQGVIKDKAKKGKGHVTWTEAMIE